MRQECREHFPHRRLQMKPLVSDPGMHHGTWCLSAMAGKMFPAFPAHAHQQFYVFGKRPIAGICYRQHAFFISISFKANITAMSIIFIRYACKTAQLRWTSPQIDNHKEHGLESMSLCREVECKKAWMSDIRGSLAQCSIVTWSLHDRITTRVDLIQRSGLAITLEHSPINFKRCLY